MSVYNDHKPLETIFKKTLLSVPMRLQKMNMSLQWYDLKVKYMRGKEMFLSDTLSRAYLQSESGCSAHSLDLESNLDMLNHLSVSSEKYEKIQNYTQLELQNLLSVIKPGWPDHKKNLPPQVGPYWNARSELTVLDKIIYRGMRIVVPPSLRRSMLDNIHKSHLGIVKCKQKS